MEEIKAPAFQLYAQDFLTGVIYLTNDEIGIYIKMLCKQWTDGKIPKKRLGFLVGCEWDSFSEELKNKFLDCGEYVVNERLEREREKKKNFLEKQKNNGKKGGRPKKNDLIKKPNKTQIKPLEDELEEEKEFSNNKKEELFKELKNSEQHFINLRRLISSKYGVSLSSKELQDYIELFLLKKSETLEEHINLNRLRDYFGNWLELQIKNKKDDKVESVNNLDV